MTLDYKSTVFLPETSFPMKAGLPQREPELLARWNAIGLYAQQRARNAGLPRFTLHDGPPYANGNIHMGTALNKLLKDIVNRSQFMLGRDVHYLPGWDCHGLPIEWKIEEKYRAAGKDKDKVPVAEFRAECRAFAEGWIAVQMEEFKRLGVLGDWANRYSTMDYTSEAVIVGECLKFLMNGALYRGSKPVMWSCVEKTALAEAEVEYHDHVSPTVHVAFPLTRLPQGLPSELDGASVVIWTTTPWTLPANRAIAYADELDYIAIRIDGVADGAFAQTGRSLLLAAALLEPVLQAARITAHTQVWRGKGADLAGAIAAHPLRGQGYDFDVPLLAGDFVTADVGTGFVHIAPGHGADDFALATKHGIETPHTVDEDGSYYPHVPLFAGKRVLTTNGKEGDANAAVADAMRAAGALLGRGRLNHSYPHSWRSKAPLIFRNTPQWFIALDRTGLRQTALKAISETAWYPREGENRIRAMVEQRPDWVISRQRAWGTPITLFLDKKTGEPLRDERVNARIIDAVRAEGADAWFTSPNERFLGPDYDPDAFEKVFDILDVWFDSGSTHAFALGADEWPASLYLEGSDQHRGWFQSSLLESCGTRGRAPYEAVLTHGFVLDAEGRKMSKSLGNTVAPQDVIAQSGADILRLWTVSSDYSDDLRIGPEILKTQIDAYRRLRNTLRYLLGNLAGFTEAERLPHDEMPELERWVLHRLSELDVQVREGYGRYEFQRLFAALNHFCASDLSAFYFDVRKDALYCDRPLSIRRRATRTVLDRIFHCLVAWLAPVLCFTAEEAWLARHPSADGSVHLEHFPTLPGAWRDEDLARKWARLRDIRRAVTGALEIERAQKRIGSSLQAAPVLFVDKADADLLGGMDFAEFCITSALQIETGPPPQDAFRLDDLPGVAVLPRPAEGQKCARCWQVLPDVGRQADHPDLCHRCADAVASMAAV